jgi:CheY-like chemotaxis protein
MGDFDASGGGDSIQMGKDIQQVFAELREIVEATFTEVSALRRLGEEVAVDVLLARAMNPVYELLQPLLPFTRIGVALREDEGDVLRAVWARTEVDKVVLGLGYSAPIPGSSLERLLDAGEPRIIDDLEVYLEEHPKSDSTQRIVEEGMRTSLTFPLSLAGKPVGVIFFSHTVAYSYLQSHIAAFAPVAEHLSAILEKWRLYNELLRLDEHTGSRAAPKKPSGQLQKTMPVDQPVIACTLTDTITAHLCRVTLEREGYRVCVYKDWETALPQLQLEPARVVLVDAVSCHNKLHLCDQFRSGGLRYESEILVVAPERNADQVLNCQLADDVLIRPLEPARLRTRVAQALLARHRRGAVSGDLPTDKDFARRYRIVRHLGSGGAGAVYAVHDTRGEYG